MQPLIIVAAAVGVFYLGWCALYPFTRCPVCSGKTRRTDGRGNYRHRRRPCWLCHGEEYRRLGARLIGRGR